MAGPVGGRRSTSGVGTGLRPPHRDGAGQGEGDEQGARQGDEPGAVRRAGAEVRVGLGGEDRDGDGGEGDGAGHDPRPDRAAAGHRVPADHREQREADGAGSTAR